jgi:uncharacterized delta-60 repeat protein
VVRTDANGKLDTSFATNGAFSQKFASLSQDGPRDVLINADDSILVVSQAFHSSSSTNRFRLEVVKLTSQGLLDFSFGSRGLVNFETSSLGSNTIGGASLDASGRLLIAATHSTSITAGDDIAVIRLKSDGKLDTFGSGGVAHANMSSTSGEDPIDVGVLANGGILLAGMVYGSIATNHVVKFSDSGQRDNAFGSSGRVAVSFNIADLEVQSDGKFLLVGTGKNGSSSQIHLARFDASGKIDGGFGSNGYLYVNLPGDPQGISVKEGQGGRIFVSGSNNGDPWRNDSVVLAFHPDGRLDTSFGNQGLMYLSLGYGAKVEVLPNGKLFLVGDKAIVRLLPDGNIDPTFEGATPVSTLDGVSQFVEGGPAVLLDNNVSVFDAELFNSGSYAGASLTLARKSAPSPDDLFAGAGIQIGSLKGDVIVAGVVIGQYAYLEGVLTLNFNHLSTRELINQAMRELSYANANKHPPSSVQIVWTFNDGAGANGGAQSSLEVVGQTLTNITNVNDRPLGNVTIAGVLEQGQTLSANHNLTDVDGLGNISYQWREDWAEIAGATGSTFTLTQAQVGKTISVMAKYVDGHGTPEAVVNSSTDTVINVNDPPLGVVTLSGKLEQGQTLNAGHNLSDVDGLGPISYQWRANEAAIEGATQSSLTLTADQVGMGISVTASYTDAMGKAESVSSSTSAELVKMKAAPVVVSPSYEMGFVFSKTHLDSPGYISTDDLLYPNSWRLVSAGNIDLSALRPDEVFYSASTPGSFAANVLQGIWYSKLNFNEVRLLVQADGTYVLTADNSFTWSMPALRGSFLPSDQLPPESVKLWPLNNINDWDQLLVSDPSQPEGVYHFRFDFDKPSIDPLLAVSLYAPSGQHQSTGLRFEGDVWAGVKPNQISLHEVLIGNDRVAVLFSLTTMVPSKQGINEAQDKLYIAVFDKALLNNQQAVTLAAPILLAEHVAGQPWQADMVVMGDGTYAIAMGEDGDTEIQVRKLVPETGLVTHVSQISLPNNSNLLTTYGLHQGLVLDARPDGQLSLAWSDSHYKVQGLVLDAATGAKTATSAWSAGIGYGYLSQAEVLPLDSGSMVAGWAQHSSLESLHGLYLALINAQGVPVDPPFQLTTKTPHKYALMPDSVGGMWVAWTEASDYVSDTPMIFTSFVRHFPDAHNLRTSTERTIGGDSDPVMDFVVNAEGHMHMLSGGEVIQLDSYLMSKWRGDDSDLVRIQGSCQNDVITGTLDSEYILGLAGDDLIEGAGGDDRIDGGTGYDTAVFSGYSGDYVISRNSDGAVSVVDKIPDRHGHDTLRNVEQLSFSNEVVVMTSANFFKINPASTYLADKTGQGSPNFGADIHALAPTRVSLAEFNATVGQFIALSTVGTWQAGTGVSGVTGQTFADINTSLLAVFVDVDGRYIAPDAHLGHTTQVQNSGKNTNISQDFYVVTGGVTQIKVPAGAVALEFSVNDSWFGDNIDPNSDFGVNAQVVENNVDYAGNNLIMGSNNNDTLIGWGGNDTLSGGGGNDLLQGGLGSDVFWGGTGSDTMEGGEQARQPWITSTAYDYDRIETMSNDLVLGYALNLKDRTITTGSDVDRYSGIEEIIGSNNKTDTVTGRTSESATEGDGAAIYLYLRGGSDKVDITAYGYQQPWSDGAIVGYHWSQTPIEVTYSSDGRTASVKYAATTTGQLAGTDTLKHVGIIGDSQHNDTFDLKNAKYNHLGYITDQAAGVSYNTLLMGRGGHDKVTGNGQTNIHFGSVTGSSNGLGVNINLTNTGAQDLSHLNTRGVTLGSVTFTGVRSVTGTQFKDTLIGGVNDKFESFRGDGGDDFIDGKTGYDRADYRSSTDAVAINMAQGVVSSSSQGTDSLRSIEEIRGSMYDDIYDARGYEGGFVSGDLNASSYWWGLNSFIPEGGNDVIYGNGATRIDYTNAMVPVVVDLGAGFADARYEEDKATPQYLTVGRDTFSDVAEVRGSSLDDELIGGGNGRTSLGLGVEVFLGNAGNDTIDGREGWDVAGYFNSPNAIRVDLNLQTGQVNDGWGFTDTVIGIEEFSGSQNDDVFIGNDENQSFIGSNGADTMDGGGGYDEVSYSLDEKGVTVNLGGWVVTGSLPSGYTGSAKDGWDKIDVFKNIEGVEGSPYNDSITGNAGNNRLDGRGGNDTLDGGDGIDWAEYNQAMFGVHVDLSQGKAFDDGQGMGEAHPANAVEQDTLRNIENVQGGYGNDLLIGNAVANHLDGGEGDDILEGRGGDDILSGYDGYDTAVFAGNKADYTVTKDDNTGWYTVTDKVAGRDGTDTLHDVERLEFADGEMLFVERPYDDSIRVDLNGDEFGAVAEYSMSPFYYWPQSNTQTGYGRAQPNPFYQAVLEGQNGIKSFIIEVDQNAQDLGLISLDWRFGWHPINQQGEITERTAKLIPFGESFAAQTFTMHSNGTAITLKVSPETITLDGTVKFGLKVETANGRLLEAQTMQDILRNIGVEYRNGTTQGAVDKKITLSVKASSDGINYAPAQEGQADTLVLEAESILPTLSTAFYSQNLISLQFATGGRPTEVADLSSNWKSWLGAPSADMFTVTVNNKPQTVSKVVMNDEVILHLASAIPANADVRVSYRDPSGDQVKNVIQTWHGLDAASFTNVQAKSYAGMRLEALEGAELGIASDRDFIWGRYISDDSSGIDEGAPAIILAMDNETFTVELLAVPLSLNPAYDPLATDGFRSYEYSSERIVLQLKKNLGFDLNVGDTFDFWSDFNDAANKLLAKSITLSVIASQEDTGANAVVFDLVKQSDINDGYQPLMSFLLKDALWGNDHITGSDLGDNIMASTGNDTVNAGGGQDTVVGGAGNDVLDGGLIVDRLNYTDLNVLSYRSSTAAVTINLSGITGDGRTGSGTVSDGFGGTDRVSNFNFIVGSNFADTITGSSALIFEQFDGGLGNDTIDGGAISDRYSLSSHNRVSYSFASASVNVNLGTGKATGGDGSDTLSNINQIRGSRFDDTLTGSATTLYVEMFEGGAGNDTIDGMGGFDIVRYDWAPGSVLVDLKANKVQSDGYGGADVLRNIEGVFGSAHDDVLLGGNTASDGSEVFRGNAGNDTIDGGSGLDRVDFTSSTSGVLVYLGGYQDGEAEDGLGGLDVLRNIEQVRGSSFNDMLYASTRANFANDGYSEQLEGLEGDDVLQGVLGGSTVAAYINSPLGVRVDLWLEQAEDGFGYTDELIDIESVRGSRHGDELIGNPDDNRLFGHEGDDILTGGGGSDLIDGGAGVDKVLFSGSSDEYVLTIDAAGQLWVIDTVEDRDGEVGLPNVEFLEFSDQTLATNFTSITQVIDDGLMNRTLNDDEAARTDSHGFYLAGNLAVVGGAGYGVGDILLGSITLTLSGKTYAFKPANGSKTALLVLDDGFEVVTGSGMKWTGQKFNAEGVAQGKAVSYTLSQLLGLESTFGEDINGIDGIGDTVALVVDDGFANREDDGDGYGLYQTASGGWIVGDAMLTSGDSTVGAISLSVAGKPYAFKPANGSKTALLVLDDGGFEVVTGSGFKWTGQKFDQFGVATTTKATAYTLSELLGLENDYQEDINGDGGIGDTIALIADDGIENREDAGDGFGLYQTTSGGWIVGASGLLEGDPTGEATTLKLPGNKPYAFKPAANSQTALLVLDDGGFEVVTGLGAKWTGQKFNAEGVANGKAVPYTLSQLLRLERAFDEDIDRDLDIGDFVQETLLVEGLYKTETGAFVIDFYGNGDSISADAIYLSVGTKPWTPGRATVLGALEINTSGSTEVLVKNGASYVAQIFNPQGLAQGSALTLKGVTLTNREYFYDLDMNGDGQIQLTGVPTGWDPDLFPV